MTTEHNEIPRQLVAEPSQIAIAVNSAINGLHEISKFVEKVEERAAEKPKESRYVNGTELLKIATKVSEVIGNELEILRENGIKENTDSVERILAALTKARSPNLRR